MPSRVPLTLLSPDRTPVSASANNASPVLDMDESAQTIEVTLTLTLTLALTLALTLKLTLTPTPNLTPTLTITLTLTPNLTRTTTSLRVRS